MCVCMLTPWYFSKNLLLPARSISIHSDSASLTLFNNSGGREVASEFCIVTPTQGVLATIEGSLWESI